MRRILKAIGWLLLALVVWALVVVAEAHLEMRRVTPELPEAGVLEEMARVSNGPIRVSYINSASQSGSGPARLGHPAFLLEWADGRGFLIDAGMDREAAEAFGRLAELALGAQPIETHGSLREQLGMRPGSSREFRSRTCTRITPTVFWVCAKRSGGHSRSSRHPGRHSG